MPPGVPKWTKKIARLSALLSALLFCGFRFASAMPYPDSLLQQLASTENDSIRVDLNNELAWTYRKNDTIRAIFHAREALSIARRTGYRRGAAESWIRLGNIYEAHARYAPARDAFQRAFEIEKSIGHQHGIARASNQLGLISKKEGDFIQARQYFQTSVAIWKKLPDKAGALAIAYYNLGNVENNLGDYVSALESYNHSLDLLKETGNRGQLGHCLLNLGTLYARTKNTDQAHRHYLEALALFEEQRDTAGLAMAYNNLGNCYLNSGRITEALGALEQSLQLKIAEGHPQSLSNTLLNFSELFALQEQWDKALHYNRQCLDIRRRVGDQNGIAQALYSAGKIFLQQNRHLEAQHNFENALTLARQTKDNLLTADILNELTRCLSQLRQFERAAAYSFELVGLRDSLENSYHEAMNIKLRYEEEQRDLALLKKEQEVQTADLQRRNTRLQGVIAVLLLTGVILLLIVVYQRGKVELERVGEEQRRAREQVEHLLREHELKYALARLEGQEAERNRIARDLHDRLGSMLSTVKLYFKAVNRQVPVLQETVGNGGASHFDKANALLDEACEEVRKIAHNMESGVLEKFGLLPQLENFAADLNDSRQLRVRFYAHGFRDRLGLNVESRIYSLIRELVSNVLRHARASELNIQLTSIGDTVNILIEDNGVGFRPETVNSRSGMGLNNIRQTVAALGGSMLIDSGKGAGTTITIDIPTV